MYRDELGQGKSPVPPAVDRVLLSLTDENKGWIRLGKCPTHTLVGGSLLSATGDIQDLVISAQTPNSSMGWWCSLFVTNDLQC